MTRCWFCLMQTSIRWLGIPLCPICRDQLYDFFWVSVVQALFWAFGWISGWFFVVDEVALFIVLVVVKHRVPVPWKT